MKNIKQLTEDLANLTEKEPKLRARDRAQRLGISEAELLSLTLGEHIALLEGDWKNLLKEVKDMGYVMALTRNESCVHERKGVYDNIEFYKGPHNMGVAVNPDIDLRFFMNEWKYGFAVSMDRGKGKMLHGLQFFNVKGEAVHKIYTTPKSNVEAFKKLVAKYKAQSQSPLMDVDHSPYAEKQITSDSEIDVNTFQQEWRDLKDTHHFFGMLKKHKLQRTQSLRLAPKGYTQKVNTNTVIDMLEKAVEDQVSIMCFVHSRGCIQIHTGEVKNLKEFGSWYNIMDPKFNLHLDMSKVAESWIVKKPTSDGMVHSLELFDENGDLIVYFFGARKPGKPELESWKSIIELLEKSNALVKEGI